MFTRNTGYTAGGRSKDMRPGDWALLRHRRPPPLSTAALEPFRVPGGGGAGSSVLRRGVASGALTHAEVQLGQEWAQAPALLSRIVGDEGFVGATVRYIHESLRWRSLGDGLAAAVEHGRLSLMRMVEGEQ